MSLLAKLSLQRLADRLGLPGVIGIGLVLFSLMYSVTASLPARDRVATLEREVAGAQQRPQQEAARGNDIESELTAFYGFFADSSSVPDALGRLNDAVARSGLTLEAAEYRLAREGTLRLTRYEVTLPLRGTYAQVRNFVSLLLDEMPQVALDDVTVKRESVSAPAIEARLRLSIYLALP